jgi:hypothetical protein
MHWSVLMLQYRLLLERSKEIMKMKQFIARIAACLLLLVSLNPVAASAAGGASSLSITPRKDYTIKSGETVKDKLSIGNLSNSDDMTVNLRMIDFTFSDDSGTPKLFLADNAPQTAWSLKPFTTLPKSVDVPAGKTVRVDYSITIPANQGAGSYYSAIMYQAGAPGGGNVSLNASGVSLAFVSVPGIVREDMNIKKLGAYATEDNGNTGKFVFIAFSEPKAIAYLLKNDGNVAESPAGSIILKNMFGHQIDSIDATNILSQLTLIGQTRRYTTCIKTVQQKLKEEGGTTKNTSCTSPKLLPGRYTATLDLFYGQNGNQTHEANKTATFWYLPWWFLLIVAAVIGLIVALVMLVRRKLKNIVNNPKAKFKTRRR